MIRQCTSECPYTGKTQTISVEYKKVPMTGTSKTNFKKIGFDCSTFSECSIQKCPLYTDMPICLTV